MTAPKDSGYLIPSERLENAILEIRGRKVMLSHDLASLYGVSTRRLNEQVKRNASRFPPDFMFQLTWEEAQALRSQSVTSNESGSRTQTVTLDEAGLRSQLATLKRGKHRKYRPYAFTEHGAVMAASILNTPRAVEVSVFVVRAFVRLGRVAADQRRFALRLDEIEAKLATHDRSFQVVFATIKQLMLPPEPKTKRIGSLTDDDKPGHAGSGSDFIARDHPRRRRR